MSISIDQLRAIDVLAMVPEKSLESLARLCTTRQASEGEILFKEGDPSRLCFALMTGEVLVQHRAADPALPPKILGRVQPGSLFGESALFSDHPRSAEAIITRSSELILIDGERFQEWTRQDPETAVGILMGLLETSLGRLHRTNQELSLIYGLGYWLGSEKPFQERLLKTAQFLKDGLWGVEAAAFYRATPLWEELELMAAVPERESPAVFTLSHPLIQKCAPSGEPGIYPLTNDTTLAQHVPGGKSLIILPLWENQGEKNRVRGLVVLVSSLVPQVIRSYQRLLLSAIAVPIQEAFSRQARQEESEAQQRLGRSRQSFSF
jgi:CRP-like cAMP-binding protein